MFKKALLLVAVVVSVSSVASDRKPKGNVHTAEDYKKKSQTQFVDQQWAKPNEQNYYNQQNGYNPNRPYGNKPPKNMFTGQDNCVLN